MVPKNNENSNGNFKLPSGFGEIVDVGDRTLLSDRSTIVIALLSILASLSGGVKYRLRQESEEEDIIVIYAASFQPTGMGKSSTISFFRKHMLLPISTKNLEIEMMIDDASAEGLEESLLEGNAPHVFLDEFGKYLQSSKRDPGKKTYIAALQSIFDAGFFVTKRRREISATPVSVSALGAYFASTVGESNLQPKAISELVSDGFLGRVLFTFYNGESPKPMQLERGVSREELSFISEFAKKYHSIPRDHYFYFSDDAIELYAHYLEKVNKERTYQILNLDDKAGLTTRLPKITTRVATIFHICKLVYTDSYSQIITKESVQYAIDFMEHLRKNHLNYVLEIARSKNGRLDSRKITFEAAQKYELRHGDGIPYKNLLGNTHMKAKELKESLILLIEEGKMAEKEGRYYVQIP